MTLRSPITDSTVLIAGTARNVAPYIRGEIEGLLDCTTGFKKVYVLVVESDSSDHTIDELDALKLEHQNFSYFSFGRLSDKIQGRTERIAYCRNQVIVALNENPIYANVDYVMLADLDGLNSLLSPKKIAQCWEVHEDWDAIFANQADHYYDIYALRHPDWGPFNCSTQQLRMEPIFGRSLAHYLAIASKQVCLHEKLGLIEVDSAFGGFGIYKKSAFLSGTYVGSEDGIDICEHVPFHRALKDQGCRLYINCALINCDKPANPLERTKGRPFLNVVKAVGRSILGRARFNKYLDLLKD